jgi:DNA-binding NarL/FixJ family response regulator
MDITLVDSSVSESDSDVHRTNSADKDSHTGKILIGWIAAASLTRECLKDLLSRVEPRFSITTFDTTHEFAHASKDHLDLVVYHSQGSETVDLSDLTALALATPASMRLVILSDAIRLASETVAEIIRRDVSGFIYTRDTSLKMVISALAFVKSGGTFIPKNFFVNDAPAGQSDVNRPRKKPLLTPRETEVLALIRQGKPNKLIAHALNLSPSTTKIHVRNVMQKLGATNRTQAAIEALRYLRPDADWHPGDPVSAKPYRDEEMTAYRGAPRNLGQGAEYEDPHLLKTQKDLRASANGRLETGRSVS